MKCIKLISLYIFIFLIIFTSEASLQAAENITDQDGNNWISGSESYKIGYVIGYISGISFTEGQFSHYERTIKSLSIKRIFKDKWERISVKNITVGQVKDGIDAFYKDFSNRRIKIIDAIYVVKMQIEGKNSELINAQIRYLKMQPISFEIIAKFEEKLSEFLKENHRYPTYKEIKNGDYSFEDVLKAGYFIDVNNETHSLFCYGYYK